MLNKNEVFQTDQGCYLYQDTIWVIDDNNNKNWFFNRRFELVKEETMFKIGDKVKCVDNSYSTLNNDDIYTVIRVCGNFDVITNNYNCKGYIDIGSGYIMKPSRFKLVKETTMFKVGDKVRCIDVKDINLNLGQTYIITEVACGIYVKVDGVVCMASRFEPVKEIEPIHIDCKRYWTWFC